MMFILESPRHGSLAVWPSLAGRASAFLWLCRSPADVVVCLNNWRRDATGRRFDERGWSLAASGLGFSIILAYWSRRYSSTGFYLRGDRGGMEGTGGRYLLTSSTCAAATGPRALRRTGLLAPLARCSRGSTVPITPPAPSTLVSRPALPLIPSTRPSGYLPPLPFPLSSFFPVSLELDPLPVPSSPSLASSLLSCSQPGVRPAGLHPSTSQEPNLTARLCSASLFADPIHRQTATSNQNQNQLPCSIQRKEYIAAYHRAPSAASSQQPAASIHSSSSLASGSCDDGRPAAPVLFLARLRLGAPCSLRPLRAIRSPLQDTLNKSQLLRLAAL